MTLNNASQPLLEVRHLTVMFGDLHAVDDVSLSIRPGETLGLVGESGCGKTTLSRAVLRLQDIDSGEVKFDDIALADHSRASIRRLRRAMQIVFQDPYASLDPRWSVFQIIAEPLKTHHLVVGSELRAEVERLLASVGLPKTAMDRYPHEFSGGQRQRIGIARALAARPKLLIADEPVSALDVSVRAQILNLLNAAQKEYQLAMLFIAHDLASVRQVSSRVIVMFQGQIVEEGDTEQIFRDPRHPYTRSLLDAIPSVHRRRQLRAPAAPPEAIYAVLDSGCRFRARCPFAQELCAEKEPELMELQDGNASRCHFAATLTKYEV